MSDLKQKCREEFRSLCNSLGIDHLDICTCGPFVSDKECKCVGAVEKLLLKLDSVIDEAVAEERERIIDIANIVFEGIDEDECESEIGWWETDKGAEFGKETLEKFISFINEK